MFLWCKTSRASLTSVLPYPYLISQASCACQVLHACDSQSARCNQCKRFFFLFFHFKGARLICQCLTQWRVVTYSTQPCQRCLWPSGKIINHHKSPPAFLLWLAPHFPPLFFTLLCHWQTPLFSHFAFFTVWHRPSPPLFLSDTHTHTHTHTHTLYIFTRRRHTFHCLDITHLGRLLSVGCKWHWEIFVRVCDHCLCSGRPVQAAGWGCAAVGILRNFLRVKKISVAWYDTKSWESVSTKIERQMLETPSFYAFFIWLYKKITATELCVQLCFARRVCL